MKNVMLIVFTSLVLFSCKSKSDKVNDFVAMYNRSSHMINSPVVTSTKAESANEDLVNITINTSLKKDDMEADLLGSAIPDLIGQAISSETLGKELLDEGVRFNLKIYDVNQSMIAGKTIDKSNLKSTNVDMKAIANGEKPSSNQLNELLEVFNKNLPIVDPSTGTKVMSIKADADNNIVYTNEVPDSFVSMLQAPGAEKLMKDEMLRSPDIRQIFTKTKVLGVKNLKYVYNDTKGIMIKEIVITAEDIK